MIKVGDKVLFDPTKFPFVTDDWAKPYLGKVLIVRSISINGTLLAMVDDITLHIAWVTKYNPYSKLGNKLDLDE